MPLYEFQCVDCGRISEVLVLGRADETPACGKCGSTHMKKLMSASASRSGSPGNRLPGAGDTACCGLSPGDAGCAGPGSCCGKNTG